MQRFPSEFHKLKNVLQQFEKRISNYNEIKIPISVIKLTRFN